MAEYRIRATGQVMLESELRQWARDNNGPTWGQTTDDVLEVLGADPVFEGAQATSGDRYQFSQRQGVEQIDGKWYTKYVLGPVFTDRPAQGDQPAQTAAEQEAAYKAEKDAERAKAVREDRNKRIADLDWTQGKDIPDAISAPAAVKRQALRDVPQQAGFPWEVQWPE